LVRRDLGR